MKSDGFDEKFDRGEDITSALDVAKVQRPGEGALPDGDVVMRSRTP